MNNSHSSCCQAHSDHDHQGHEHGSHEQINIAVRWLLSLLLVASVLFFLRSFLISQMLVRVVSYSAYRHYDDVVRVCKKILIFDKNNKPAWTALGFAYIDEAKLERGIEAFAKVLLLNPQDRGAASFELGRAYFLKKDYTQAISYFERIRQAGHRAGFLLDADMLKYRHGTSGFQSVHSMGSLLAMLGECYKQTGDMTQAAEIQKEYDVYSSKHKAVLF